MLKIGHRGAKGYAKENTLESFQKALDLFVDGIELDVHLSFDKQIIVIHDDSIDRTTSKKGFVKEFTASQLEKLGIPTLKQVLELIKNRCFINIEIKNENVSDYILEFIEEEDLNTDLIQISSFDWNVLCKIHTKNNTIALGVLTENSIDDALVFAKKINAYSINPYFKLLNSENVLEIHNNGFKIFPWTVNIDEEINLVKTLKVDGIISDFPDRI